MTTCLFWSCALDYITKSKIALELIIDCTDKLTAECRTNQADNMLTSTCGDTN